MQTNDAETAEQIAALESVVPALRGLEGLLARESARRRSALERATTDLAKLGERIASERDRKMTALKAFADDNHDLAKLEKLHKEWIAQLDIFNVLGVAHSELHHSRFLRWLLDPHETHGVGDHFLKSFLFQTCATAGKMGLPTVVPARIHATNWSRTEVRREWQYIDILILNQEARFVCAIENKIWADEGIGSDGKSQLSWYRETLKTCYPDFAKHYIFLSPSGMPSQIHEERKYWTPQKYSTILQLVEQTIEHKHTAMSKDVRSFLRQYAATLRRNKIVPESNEIAELARKIYLEHREVMDLIFDNRPDWVTDAKQIFKAAIAKQNNLLLDTEDRDWMGFRSADWDSFEVTKTGTNWASLGSNVLLLFQIRFYNGLPWLDLGLSSGNDGDVRERLFETVRQHPEAFRLVQRFSEYRLALHQQEDYILDDSDYGVGWDDGTTRAKIEAWVKNFAENEFPAMNEVIVNCLREYEAETKGQ